MIRMILTLVFINSICLAQTDLEKSWDFFSKGKVCEAIEICKNNENDIDYIISESIFYASMENFGLQAEKEKIIYEKLGNKVDITSLYALYYYKFYILSRSDLIHKD